MAGRKQSLFEAAPFGKQLSEKDREHPGGEIAVLARAGCRARTQHAARPEFGKMRRGGWARGAALANGYRNLIPRLLGR
jgi:hypothetical protein